MELICTNMQTYTTSMDNAVPVATVVNRMGPNKDKRTALMWLCQLMPLVAQQWHHYLTVSLSGVWFTLRFFKPVCWDWDTYLYLQRLMDQGYFVRVETREAGTVPGPLCVYTVQVSQHLRVICGNLVTIKSVSELLGNVRFQNFLSLTIAVAIFGQHNSMEIIHGPDLTQKMS